MSQYARSHPEEFVPRVPASYSLPDFDADEELQMQQESLAADYERGAPERAKHRCPSAMPPCPVCQQLDDEENEREGM